MQQGQPCLVLPIVTPAQFAAAVSRAEELLRAGDVVAVPTETVYGLAANASHGQAVSRIFALKGRPAHNPIIVHVAGLEMARICVTQWPDAATRLAAAFWPGPLTLVLPRSELIPDQVTAGGQTVGIRWPRHPFIQALIAACGFPLAAPSANLASGLSPTQAAHVHAALGDKIPLIVDGGPTEVGIESTVLDLTTSPPSLLRLGMIGAEAILAVTGDLKVGDDEREAGLRSPGLLRKHYAPKAKLVVGRWTDEADLRRQIASWNCPWERVQVIAHSSIPEHLALGRVSVLPREATAFARAIYAELHRCDETGARLIVVESPPETPEWQAIHDRLQRAAS